MAAAMVRIECQHAHHPIVRTSVSECRRSGLEDMFDALGAGLPDQRTVQQLGETCGRVLVRGRETCAQRASSNQGHPLRF